MFASFNTHPSEAPPLGRGFRKEAQSYLDFFLVLSIRYLILKFVLFVARKFQTKQVQSD